MRWTKRRRGVSISSIVNQAPSKLVDRQNSQKPHDYSETDLGPDLVHNQI